jgi:CDGSH-type Zn-finger protein
VANGPGERRIEIEPNGPYRVTGVALVRMRPVPDEDGRPVAWERTAELGGEDVYRLCRCGASKSMPFCDESEERVEFDGSETANRGPGDERRFRSGSGELELSDDPSICSKAGFCMRRTTDAWTLVDEVADPGRRALLEKMVGNCPSGRIVLHRASDGAEVEAPPAPQIAVTQNGPLWVRGGVPLFGGDGFTYEVRNRMTLCRCGHSRNKPFCDGSHARVGFTDPA